MNRKIFSTIISSREYEFLIVFTVTFVDIQNGLEVNILRNINYAGIIIIVFTSSFIVCDVDVHVWVWVCVCVWPNALCHWCWYIFYIFNGADSPPIPAPILIIQLYENSSSISILNGIKSRQSFNIWHCILANCAIYEMRIIIFGIYIIWIKNWIYDVTVVIVIFIVCTHKMVECKIYCDEMQLLQFLLQNYLYTKWMKLCLHSFSSFSSCIWHFGILYVLSFSTLPKRCTHNSTFIFLIFKNIPLSILYTYTNVHIALI